MIVRTSSFKVEDLIPSKYTCDGEDLSPTLEWDAVPSAKSYAVIVEDPDAPGGTFIHWVIYNIPTNKLPEGVPKVYKSEFGIQGVNDFGRVGYNGPCPPKAHPPHRYYFYVYALDTILKEVKNVDANELKSLMKGHEIDKGYVMGKYKRK
ncbi:phosphatidylethanolamine-binding protein [Sulfolobus sp. A20]|uniref:YbhB/YbcL family Raf kinase inhibitor-like protein n=1 Tax=Sulfolobaceae TaxID=118883 RepID=UPI000845CF68|nr:MULTISPECIES: YbhB/YbcL family Raf kinase inhibitor-like protein [unclassified Sulfolobus]TRM74188.1 YbhB/YbcL family Raf kinase inhibitor-like protein [Sulfolobus sp. E5]TRM77918.1 YbhB/YbcL family Raf kinase inhibitor-like protein [Sulfolobus sp. D5]TRM78289.1 YbhB/YbcL family Raf kinase inhibitor-like protein [Sulfolobus sp. A20-N-F8]TRM99673.1 YbhB/YbcL family Raf kinase inhibitor-like protein [Sulfolobus sp. E1]TRN01165.1 YbhB/YbcL family Raf kinase inhibitor-like protein [Sulfolobus s